MWIGLSTFAPNDNVDRAVQPPCNSQTILKKPPPVVVVIEPISEFSKLTPEVNVFN